MIRLLIVDDHELVREGLRQILVRYPSIELVGEAANGETAIRLNRLLKPDVALVDICMPGLSGLELTTRLKQARPTLAVLVLSVHEAAPIPGRVMEAGASGYLSKGCPVTEIVQAIRTVSRGGRHVGSAVAQKMALDRLPGKEVSPFEALSARELEVLMMLADGQRISEVAEAMHLSPKTIATYKYRIFDKLDTRNDVEMTRMAVRYGIVTPA
ncbi:response regulator [Elongatibacter sediminis]|uniref:Response regulator n=1 Tax=Elongatibacter sediminis TaxID=3119006 RepID=A0AAW9RDI1_9GAMM